MEHWLSPSIQQWAIDLVTSASRHPLLGYWVPAAIASLLLLLASLLGTAPKRDASDARLRRSDLVYLLALALFLFALRWPALAIADLEGDESVAVSAAITRYLDPAYGVTLFTGSAGPLLTYPVSALGLLGFRIDYGASKLVSLLLITASSTIQYLTLRILGEARLARIALLPQLAFLGLCNGNWTLLYCSEQWINLFVISMIWFLLRLDRRMGRPEANLCGMGFALGSIPLVKWQGIPMAALVIACATLLLAKRCLREGAGFRRLALQLLPLVVLGLAPLLVWCAVQWSSGNLEFFLDTYFAALFAQATSRFSSTFLERLAAMPEWALVWPMARSFLATTALFSLLAGVALVFLPRPRRFGVEIGLAALYLVASLYAVLQPGGRFPHYLYLLLQSYGLFFALIFLRLAEAAPRRAFVLSAYLGITVLIPAIYGVQRIPNSMLVAPLPVNREVVGALRALRISGSPMIQWGWECGYYVQTGTTWGTRTGGSHEILESFLTDKAVFVEDYLESLDSGRAPVFLDTADEPSTFYGDRARYGHEQFPEIAEAVRRNYFPCAEFPGARLFLQRERYRGRPEIRSWCARLAGSRRPQPPDQAASSRSWRS